MQGLYQDRQQLVGSRELPVRPETGPASGALSLGGSKPFKTQVQLRVYAQAQSMVMCLLYLVASAHATCSKYRLPT